MQLLFLAMFIFDSKSITIYDGSVKQIEKDGDNKIPNDLSIDSKLFLNLSYEDKNKTDDIVKSVETETIDNAAHTHINENPAKNYQTVNNETSFFENINDDIEIFGKNLPKNTENADIVIKKDFVVGNETYSTETTDESFKHDAKNDKADTNKDTARLSENFENNKEFDMPKNNAFADENAVYNTTVGENTECNIENNKTKNNEGTAGENVVDESENTYADAQATTTDKHDTNLVSQKITLKKQNNETTMTSEPIYNSNNDNVEGKNADAIYETLNFEDISDYTNLYCDEHINASCTNSIQIEDTGNNSISLNLQDNNEEDDWENEFEILTVNYGGDDNFDVNQYTNNNPSVDFYKEDKHILDVRFLVKVPKYISIALRLYNFFIMEARSTKSQSQSADECKDIEDSDGFVLLDMSMQDHLEYISMERESAEIFNFGVRYPIESNKMEFLKKLWLLYQAVAENKTIKSVYCYAQIAQILAKNFFIYNFYEEITNCVKLSVTTSIYI